MDCFKGEIVHSENMKEDLSSLPYDGAISRYLLNDAPVDIREAILQGKKRDVITKSYPYRRALDKKQYYAEMDLLQVELVKFQSWVQQTGQRVAILFEGRDAAGKGGSIRAVTENLNPRVTRVVALPKPSDTERGEWYFQRYVQHFPSAGTMTVFDRSWYNRSVVERVFGFCDDQQVQKFFVQVPEFEHMLAEEGIHLMKFWLNVGRAEQLRRFLRRERDPIKQWTLSPVDVKGLSLWETYSDAIRKNFEHTHHESGPWCVVRSDDKKRARLAVIRQILSRFQYDSKNEEIVNAIDPKISGGPDIWHG